MVRFITELAVAPDSDGLREHIRDQQLGEARHFADIVEEGKAQGCIRPDVDSEDAAWRIMSVHWLEAMARLHGLEDKVMSGFSTRIYQSILKSIATDPDSVSLEDDGTEHSLVTHDDGALSEAPTVGRTPAIAGSPLLLLRPLGFRVVRTTSGCY